MTPVITFYFHFPEPVVNGLAYKRSPHSMVFFFFFSSPENTLECLLLSFFFFFPCKGKTKLKEQYPAALSLLRFSSAGYLELHDVTVS